MKRPGSVVAVSGDVEESVDDVRLGSGARKVDVQALPRRGACRQPLWPQRDPPLADTPRRLERACSQVAV